MSLFTDRKSSGSYGLAKMSQADLTAWFQAQPGSKAAKQTKAECAEAAKLYLAAIANGQQGAAAHISGLALGTKGSVAAKKAAATRKANEAAKAAKPRKARKARKAT